VDRDPLNFFQPFEKSPANQENQLTRALLVVLVYRRWRMSAATQDGLV
jgi:hypothetical protein